MFVAHLVNMHFRAGDACAQPVSTVLMHVKILPTLSSSMSMLRQPVYVFC